MLVELKETFNVYSFFYSIMKESPRWAMNRQNYKKAHKSLAFVTKINDKSTPETKQILESVVPFEESKDENKNAVVAKHKRYGFRHLFATKKLATYTIVLALCK